VVCAVYDGGSTQHSPRHNTIESYNCPNATRLSVRASVIVWCYSALNGSGGGAEQRSVMSALPPKADIG